MCLITDAYDAGYGCCKKEKDYDLEGSEAVGSAKNELACLQRDSNAYISKIQKMRLALDLAKKMIIANGLDIPNTMAVIDDALGT